MPTVMSAQFSSSRGFFDGAGFGKRRRVCPLQPPYMLSGSRGHDSEMGLRRDAEARAGVTGTHIGRRVGYTPAQTLLSSPGN